MMAAAVAVTSTPDCAKDRGAPAVISSAADYFRGSGSTDPMGSTSPRSGKLLGLCNDGCDGSVTM
jgi:hypothetical protein